MIASAAPAIQSAAVRARLLAFGVAHMIVPRYEPIVPSTLDRIAA